MTIKIGSRYKTSSGDEAEIYRWLPSDNCYEGNIVNTTIYPPYTIIARWNEQGKCLSPTGGDLVSEIDATIPVYSLDKDACECGSASVGGPGHSHWCPRWER